MEERLNRLLSKLVLCLVKFIPVIIAVLYLLNAILSYINCDTDWIPDGADGLTFNRWIADMKWLGIPIPWDEFI